MDVTDETKVKRVWSRVMNVPGAQTQPQASDCACRITPEQTAALVRAELDSAATYRYLSCRVCGCARRTLQRLAEQERCHAKMLAAYYFLLTGKKLCSAPAKPACVSCVNETLRQLYEKERMDARRYRELAPLAGERGCTFQTLSREEEEHAHRIFCILQKTL